MDLLNSCIFCKIIKGELPCEKVYEDEKVFAFHDINPQASVHFLIVPKTHLSILSEMTLEDGPLLGHMMLLAPRLVSELGFDVSESGGFRLIMNTGRDGGQEVFHVHLHVLVGLRKHKTKTSSSKEKLEPKVILPNVESKNASPHALDVLAISKGSVWASVANGRLGATGAPGKLGVYRWQDAGATAIITLQRDSELSFSSSSNNEKRCDIELACEELGLVWLHLPLAGKQSVLDPDEADDESLSRLSTVADMLRRGECVVVHCAAGLHRTGAVCYIVLRFCGFDPEAAMSTLHQMRGITHQEMTRVDKKSGRTLQMASERSYQRLLLLTSR